MRQAALFFALEPGLFAALAGVLGLVVGSFLNVVILRLPVMLERRWRRECEALLHPEQPAAAPAERFDLLAPGSRCPHCGHAIRWYENIPLLSFLLLRGRCAACRQPISWRYPLVELLSGALSAAVALRFGFGIETAAALVLTWALLAAAFIDYDTQWLPDDITLPLLWAGLLLALFTGALAPLPAAVLGAAVGYGSLWLVFQVFRLLTGKEGMGYGDFKLFAALGAWLGWTQLPLVILLASFAGALTGLAAIAFLGHERHRPIPFGPFLCLAGWVALMWGEDLTRWYLGFARLV
jgi:leader peptidase (prepilin peptidase)/N-methyltransferase